MQRVAGDAAVKNADRQRGYKESRCGPPAKGREGFHDVASELSLSFQTERARSVIP